MEIFDMAVALLLVLHWLTNLRILWPALDRHYAVHFAGNLANYNSIVYIYFRK